MPDYRISNKYCQEIPYFTIEGHYKTFIFYDSLYDEKQTETSCITLTQSNLTESNRRSYHTHAGGFVVDDAINWSIQLAQYRKPCMKINTKNQPCTPYPDAVFFRSFWFDDVETGFLKGLQSHMDEIKFLGFCNGFIESRLEVHHIYGKPCHMQGLYTARMHRQWAWLNGYGIGTGI